MHFPKFSITTSYVLDQILPLLGFTDLLSPQADFSGIIKQGHLQVPKVSHPWPSVPRDLRGEGDDFCLLPLPLGE